MGVCPRRNFSSFFGIFNSSSEKSKRVSIQLRQFPIDYLGNICLVEGQSAGAPGMSHYICPLNDTFNNDKKIFEIDPVLIKK